MQAIPKKRYGYFPFEYLRHLLHYLKNNNQFEIITYDDLSWQEEDSPLEFYPNEYKNWVKKADRNKIYILLQHDVDFLPEKTHNLLEEELQCDIKSNVMIFNKRLDRPKLKENELLFTNYEIDKNLLKKCEKRGFIVGYHNNAVEQALYNLQNAEKIFKNDVGELKKSFNIKYFSAHGGVPNNEKINNTSMHYKYDRKLLWVHNKISVKFEKTYSDGGINGKNTNPDERSLVSFLNNMKCGKRYRILLHPQYYDNNVKMNKNIENEVWYKNIIQFDYTKDNFFNAHQTKKKRCSVFKKIFKI